VGEVVVSDAETVVPVAFALAEPSRASGVAVEYQPRPKTSVFPATTLVEYPRPHDEDAQFGLYPFWTSEGELAATVTEFDTPSVKASPRVSVGVDGGLWPYHPSAKASVFPEATFEVNARPQDAELQFEL
jgi:hypothetical protein